MKNDENKLIRFLALSSAMMFLHVFWLAQPNPACATIYFDMVLDESRQLIYGSDRDGGKLDIISMETLSRVHTLEVGSQPTGMDMSPDGTELAVALYGQSEIAFIDLATLVVTSRLVLEVTVGPNQPYDVLYGRPGRLYSVGNPSSSGFDYVHVIDTVSKNEVGRSLEIMRAAPRLAITADFNTLYVSQVIFIPQKIYRFDITTDTPVQTAAAPHGGVYVNTLTVKPDGSRVYSSRGQVWSGDLTTLLNNSVQSGEEIEYSDPLQKFFVTYGSRIYEYNANNYTLTRQLKFLGTGGVSKVNASGTFLYVSTTGGIVCIDLVTGTVIQGAQKFPWPMFLAFITKDSCERRIYWGAHSHVCCRTSPATFSVTIESITKSSYSPNCGMLGTWEGWEKTTAGNKNVTWQLTSKGCGTINGSFTWDMELGSSYVVQVEIVDGELKLFVYRRDSCLIDLDSKVTSCPSSQDCAETKEEKALQTVREIILGVLPDTFTANTCL